MNNIVTILKKITLERALMALLVLITGANANTTNAVYTVSENVHTQIVNLRVENDLLKRCLAIVAEKGVWDDTDCNFLMDDQLDD